MTSEELKALLAKESAINAAEVESDKSNAARERAAKDWIQHFVYITKFKQELLDGGLKPEEFTAAYAQKALVAKWNSSAEVKATEAI